MIKNPAYKGEWVHPKISNPDYKEDDEIYVYESNKFIGVEIWQVKSGSIFDNFLITDDVEVAKQRAEKTLQQKAGEKLMSEKKSEEKQTEPSSEDFDDADDLDEKETEQIHDEL